jgi:hypothetical protein
MKKKSAWLIAWEGSEQRLSQKGGPRFVAFIDGRRSRTALRDMIFAIYLSSTELTPEEKVTLALNNDGRKRLQKEDAVSVQCGFNPWVVARQVEKIEVEAQEDGFSIRWKQPIFRISEKDGYLRYSHSIDFEEKIRRSA